MKHSLLTDEDLVNCNSPVNKQFEFRVLQEQTEFTRPEGSLPKRLNFFEIIWVKKGAGTISIDTVSHQVSHDQIYCITPGQFRLLKLSGEIDGYYIALSVDFIHAIENHTDFCYLESQYLKKWTLPLIYPDAEMEDLLSRIQKEYSNYLLHRSAILQGLLKVFLIYVSRQLDNQEVNILSNKDAGMVKKFYSLLKKHYATKKLVCFYADELCVTPNYLNSMVKKVTGFPASHHIQQYIVLEAKRQTLYSGLRLKEVAEILGFEDYAHFSKFFKNYSGVNFSSFKKGASRSML